MTQEFTEKEIRLRCLEMATTYAATNPEEGLCHHEIQRVVTEYFIFVMSGEASVHEEGFDHSQMAQA